ncbi:unnamed protein product [Durusdinium trenchii]|uniref:PrcB C-terminal domain-containing protein n=1 Tax=Durusdinium trenchii TaxID=1381693 RepID=A0ABP0NJ49_9DINO
MAVSFDTVLVGDDSGVEEEVKRAIMSKTELEEIWTKHASISSPPEPVPDIDFETEMVVCAFAGEQGSGGYTIRVTSVEDLETERKITIEFTCPPATAITTCDLTQPHHIVRMPKTSLPITFTDVTPATRPAEDSTTFLLTLHDAKSAEAADKVKSLPHILETKAMFDGAILSVKVDTKSVTAAEAQRMLESIDGINSVEKDG